MGGNKKNRGKSKNRKNSNNNKGGGFGGNKQNNVITRTRITVLGGAITTVDGVEIIEFF